MIINYFLLLFDVINWFSYEEKYKISRKARTVVDVDIKRATPRSYKFGIYKYQMDVSPRKEPLTGDLSTQHVRDYYRQTFTFVICIHLDRIK